MKLSVEEQDKLLARVHDLSSKAREARDAGNEEEADKLLEESYKLRMDNGLIEGNYVRTEDMDD